jgi:uncharacterized membrane protein YgcG
VTLHSWKEAALALHELLEEKSERATVATLQEVRALPIYGIPILCALMQAFLLVAWIFYWMKAAGSAAEFLSLLGIVCIFMGIGLPMVVSRMRRNHVLLRRRMRLALQRGSESSEGGRGSRVGSGA